MGIPPFQSDADRAKQSQFTRRCRAQLYKQTQSGVPGCEQACRREQTKPIGWRCRAGRGPVVRTNPIWGCPAARRGVVVNKQSQTWATWGIWGTMSKVLYKQTQFGGTPAASCRFGPARAGCTNKPNSRRCADQEIGVPRRRIAQNEPNFRRHRVARGMGEAGAVRTKPIPGTAGRAGVWGRRDAGQMCKTKPIPGGQDSDREVPPSTPAPPASALPWPAVQTKPIPDRHEVTGPEKPTQIAP